MKIIILLVNLLMFTGLHAEVFSQVLAGSFFELPGLGSAYTSPDVSVATKLHKTDKRS